jgi:hypothetical protein
MSCAVLTNAPKQKKGRLIERPIPDVIHQNKARIEHHENMRKIEPSGTSMVDR